MISARDLEGSVQDRAAAEKKIRYLPGDEQGLPRSIAETRIPNYGERGKGKVRRDDGGMAQLHRPQGERSDKRADSSESENATA